MKEKKREEKEILHMDEIQEKKFITLDYECDGNCRTCPFPGAKCVLDPTLWKRIK